MLHICTYALGGTLVYKIYNGYHNQNLLSASSRPSNMFLLLLLLVVVVVVMVKVVVMLVVISLVEEEKTYIKYIAWYCLIISVCAW